MKRYSIVSSSTRRKSTATAGSSKNEENILKDEPATLELERLEQEITLSLQEIDKNLSKSNAIINDKIFPVLKNYGRSSSQVWQNVNFWKYFMEQSANVELHGYEEPANRSTDTNTLHNAKSGGDLLDDVQLQTNSGQADESAGKVGEAESNDNEGSKFKRPFNKAFQNVEDTPTWSTEQPQPKTRIQSSTPQYKRVAATGKSGFSNPGRFDSSDSLKLQPPTTITNIFDSPPKITHTIRKSLDNYHKVSISPRKRTPVRERESEYENRRSSLIQNLIDSSPTLPEPPVLLSEFGAGKDVEVLSPVRLDESESKRASLQRFPSTPKYRSSNPGSRGESPRKSVSPAKARSIPIPGPSSSEELPRSPELKSNRSQKSKKPKAGNDDEDNVFLDTTTKADGDNNSATSTVYHSIMKQASRENSHNHSATFSLFQEVHENSSLTKKGDAEGSATVANDIFGDIIPRQEDVTGGSTGELGSFLTERFNNFTK
ncbi:hypothetical protein CLIB1423_16S02256 [[Candida] railenensis]|uniref:DASH complex subunit ASK1 n=1 Tax=[Candida] railenensis TaxID=45579 RepID=A0A9P0VZY5_9ASCO|nr:hypothetical protein CLIB1423_16S02256 [[Candida] railenensis]